MLVAVARRKDFATAARTKPRLEAELDVSRRWDGKVIAVVVIERRQSANRAVLLRLSNNLELS